MSYSEDIFPGVTSWETTGYDLYKVWPNDPMPAQVTRSDVRPSIAHYSQNGRKYTRRSSFAKTTMEFEYPPLTHEQFLQFHAVALAAQGQYNPFLVYWEDRDFTRDCTLFTEATVGDTEITITGLPPGFVVKRGTYVGIKSRNGDSNVLTSNATANVWGEATFRLAYPLETTIAIGADVRIYNQQSVATLADDGFMYETDEAGLYYLKVAFDFDEWK